MSIVAPPPVPGAAWGEDVEWEPGPIPVDPLAGLDDDPGCLAMLDVAADIDAARVAAAGPDVDHPPVAAPFPPVALPRLVEDRSREVVQAVFRWQLAVKRRQQAEAVEAAAMLQAEAAFRAAFTEEHDAQAWDDGGARTFVIDAALITGCGERTAAHRLDVAHRLRDALPLTWGLHAAGEVSAYQVGVIATEADGLDPLHLPAYDAGCVAELERQPGSRLKRKVAAVRERVQARAADERHRHARAERRAYFEVARDGMAWLHLCGPAERLGALDQAADTAAVAAHGHEGETRTLAALKYDVLEDVAFDGFAISAAGIRDGLLAVSPDGQQRGQAVPARMRIQTTVVLHVPVLTLLGKTDELPALDGIGPVSPGQAKALCADAPSFYRVLTHPVTGHRITLDRTTYSPPADLRRWIQIRDEYGRFPGCLRPAHRCDIDHIRDWHDDGVTNDDDLIALPRDEHILKGKRLYGIDGDPNGEITFTSPMGLKHTSAPRDPAEPCPF